ncbi:hypothetical protein [Oceanidesulfovibrio marinus]|uniref:Uncharacterized protein n=2 Tax=Oceanidesulfovibrio marinus TaxID=370038 RepID=A0ABX6NLV5_9BACT|nr:hypothetical protein [Oceanidesulfovibrio marinus]QJT11109.1 hypothetical protein E8L03_20305 [Oceanidesulfovibrio marinus]
MHFFSLPGSRLQTHYVIRPALLYAGQGRALPGLCICRRDVYDAPKPPPPHTPDQGLCTTSSSDPKEATMAEEVTESYKGQTIKLTPKDEKCSQWALTLLDSEGNEWQHVPMAGDTKESALDRGRQMIDHEEARKG